MCLYECITNPEQCSLTVRGCVVVFQDFLKFLVFTTIAVVGFMVSLRNLFWWYSDQAEKRGVDVRKWSPNATESAITSFYE